MKFENNYDAIAVIDIGHETTQFIIITASSMWMCSIPIGGKSLIIDALAKSFKLSETKAQTLLKDAKDSKYSRQIFQSMRPVFINLTQEIQHSVGIFESTHRQQKVKK